MADSTTIGPAKGPILSSVPGRDDSRTIHEAWLTRPEDLRRIMALLAGLEVPPPRANGSQAQDEDEEYPPDRFDDPEGRAPARPSNRPDRGDAWEPPAEDPDEDAPRDGRQLLGWASKQVPDLKGILIGYGKKKGLHSKIVEWTPQQVAAAYRYAQQRRDQDDRLRSTR